LLGRSIQRRLAVNVSCAADLPGTATLWISLFSLNNQYFGAKREIRRFAYRETIMANPTPRADALRQMREAKFEAEQKRLKQESVKPAEPKPVAAKEPKPVVAKEPKPAVAEEKSAAVEEPAKKAVKKKAAAKKAKK
jgi:cell division septation protein DedD